MFPPYFGRKGCLTRLTQSCHSVGVSQVHQRQHRSRRVVAIGDSAGEVGPGPAAGGGVGVGMHDSVLLAEQPGSQAGAGVERHVVPQGVDRQRRHPRRQVRVDRPGTGRFV